MRPPRVRLLSQNSLPDIFPTRMDIFHMLGHRRECGSITSQTSSASVVSDASHNKNARKPHLPCPALPGISLQTWLRDSYAPPGIAKQAGRTLSLCGSLSEQVAKVYAGDQSPHNHRVLTVSSERQISPSLFADSLVGVGAFFGSSERVPAPSSARHGILFASTRLPTLSSAFPDTLPLPPASGLPSLSAGDTVSFSNYRGGAGRGAAGNTPYDGGANGGGNQPQVDKTRGSTNARRNRHRNPSNRNNGHSASPFVKGGSLVQFLENTRLACLLYKLDPEAYWRCAQEHFVSAAATLDHLPRMHRSEIAGNVLKVVLGISKDPYLDKFHAGSVTSDKRIWQMALCIIVPLMLPVREKLQPYVGQPLLKDTDYRSELVKFYRQAHQGGIVREPASVSLPVSSPVVNGVDVMGGGETAQISPYTPMTACETSSSRANSPTCLQYHPSRPAVFSSTLYSTSPDHLQYSSRGVYHKDLCQRRAYIISMLCYLQSRVVKEDLEPERDRQIALLKAEIDMLEALADHHAANNVLSIQSLVPPPLKATFASGPLQPDSLLPRPSDSGERPPHVLWLPPITPQNQQHMQSPSPIRRLSPPGLAETSDTASLSTSNSVPMAHESTQPTPPQDAELDISLPSLEKTDVDYDGCHKVQSKLCTPASSIGVGYLNSRILQKDRQQRSGGMAVTTSASAEIPWGEFLNPQMMKEHE